MNKKYIRKRSWSESDLRAAASSSTSIRQVLLKIGLREAGGNYSQLKKYLEEYEIDTTHFTGKGWKKGRKDVGKNIHTLDQILVKNSTYQTYKLKLRLFKACLKTPICEICGWNKESADGRIPVELDHINGDRRDNRIDNLRILCPNCHSLQPTHRGLNIKPR